MIFFRDKKAVRHEDPLAEPNPAPPLLEPEVERQTELSHIKSRVHQNLVNRVDLGKLGALEEQAATEEIRRTLGALLDAEASHLNPQERLRLALEMEFEILGLGPLEPLMRDPAITDILVNGFDQVYVERGGQLEEASIRFQDNAHLMATINKIADGVGRNIDECSPMVDARLPDGSRVNAIIPPLAIDGPLLSIRRFGSGRWTLDRLISQGTLTQETGLVLQAIIKARLNILISGGTGSGKTTLLNIIAGFISPKERIVTIEDPAELRLPQRHVCRLETRPPNIEGKGRVTQRDLVINALRMRPNRIIVGEVRGAEVMDMLQAMNTGHEGSLTTIHANSPRDALLRLETMMGLSGQVTQDKMMRRLISSSLDVIIHLARHSDGIRRVEALSEITGMEGDVITLQDIFIFNRRGMDATGRILGNFSPTGIRPRFCDRCQAFGVELPARLFRP